MALLSEVNSLDHAWRALSGMDTASGWRTITLGHSASCSLLAGRGSPGGEEAVIAGFEGIRPPSEVNLPHGHGFKVTGLADHGLDPRLTWFVLSRKAAGPIDLFTMMAHDIVGMLVTARAAAHDRQFQMFLTRIRAWQDFMERGRDGVLSPEAEVGLFGELIILNNLLRSGIPAVALMECWEGPIDGLQDFMIGSGAIEVKTTVATGAFPVTVSSLEQLDETLRQPLFVAAVRLSLGKGLTLTQLIDLLRHDLTGEPVAHAMFESRLLQAGYLQFLADRYIRQFSHLNTRILPVVDGFPRLTRGLVNPAIRKARYEIDLDLADMDSIALEDALKCLGGI